MLKKQQVMGTQTIVRGNPGQPDVPFVSHILMVENSRRVAVYDKDGVVTVSDTPIFRARSAADFPGAKASGDAFAPLLV